MLRVFGVGVTDRGRAGYLEAARDYLGHAQRGARTLSFDFREEDRLGAGRNLDRQWTGGGDVEERLVEQLASAGARLARGRCRGDGALEITERGEQTRRH